MTNGKLSLTRTLFKTLLTKYTFALYALPQSYLSFKRRTRCSFNHFELIRARTNLFLFFVNATKPFVAPSFIVEWCDKYIITIISIYTERFVYFNYYNRVPILILFSHSNLLHFMRFMYI